MKLAIFGATGGTGKRLVEQALAAGNQVVAFVRDPSKLTTYEDIVNTAQVVRASDCDWTIVRVSMLIDAPKTGRVKVGYVDKAMGMRLSRADMTEFMLKQVQDTKYLRQAPAISN